MVGVPLGLDMEMLPVAFSKHEKASHLVVALIKWMLCMLQTCLCDS